MSRDEFGRDVPDASPVSRSREQIESSYQPRNNSRRANNNDDNDSRRPRTRKNQSRSRSRDSRRTKNNRRRSRSPARRRYWDEYNKSFSRRRDRSSSFDDDERKKSDRSDNNKSKSTENQSKERNDDNPFPLKNIFNMGRTDDDAKSKDKNLGTSSSPDAKDDGNNSLVLSTNVQDRKVERKNEERKESSNGYEIKSPEQKKKVDERSLKRVEKEEKKKKKKHLHKHKHSKRDRKDEEKDSKSRKRSKSDKHEKKRKKHRHRHRASSSSSSSSDSSSSFSSLSSSDRHRHKRDRLRREKDKTSKGEIDEYQGGTKEQPSVRVETQPKTEVDAPSSSNKEDASKLLVLPPSTPGTGTILTIRDTVKGLATRFKAEVAAHDAVVIRVGTPDEEFRRIRFVLSDNSMSISQPFSKDLDKSTPFHIIRDPRRAQSLMSTSASATGASVSKESGDSSLSASMSREELLEYRMKSKTDRMC